MESVNIRSLKDQLSSYVHRVESGEQIIVVRDGRPVAALVPLDAVRPSDEASSLEGLAARGHVKLPGAGRPGRFLGPRIHGRGKSAAAMVIEDRR